MENGTNKTEIDLDKLSNITPEVIIENLEAFGVPIRIWHPDYGWIEIEEDSILED